MLLTQLDDAQCAARLLPLVQLVHATAMLAGLHGHAGACRHLSRRLRGRAGRLRRPPPPGGHWRAPWLRSDDRVRHRLAGSVAGGHNEPVSARRAGELRRAPARQLCSRSRSRRGCMRRSRGCAGAGYPRRRRRCDPSVEHGCRGVAATEALGQALDLIVPKPQRQRHFAGSGAVIESGPWRYARATGMPRRILRVEPTRQVHRLQAVVVAHATNGAAPHDGTSCGDGSSRRWEASLRRSCCGIMLRLRGEGRSPSPVPLVVGSENAGGSRTPGALRSTPGGSRQPHLLELRFQFRGNSRSGPIPTELFVKRRGSRSGDRANLPPAPPTE